MIGYFTIGFIVAVWAIEENRKFTKEKDPPIRIITFFFIMLIWPIHLILWVKKMKDLSNKK